MENHLCTEDFTVEISVEDMLKIEVLSTYSHEPSETLICQNIRAFPGRDMNSGSPRVTVL